jgi:hypothetical protein
MMNRKLGKVRKEVATDFFKVLFQHSSVDIGILLRASE